jgi:hypothetical protein
MIILKDMLRISINVWVTYDHAANPVVIDALDKLFIHMPITNKTVLLQLWEW